MVFISQNTDFISGILLSILWFYFLKDFLMFMSKQKKLRMKESRTPPALIYDLAKNWTLDCIVSGASGR